ncbi:MAG: GNAT family N-acetyltransferase [Acidimicrobiia bacterium]
MSSEADNVRSVAVTIRPMEGRDLPLAASLHLEHLPHGFFPSLGPRFMRRYLGTFRDPSTSVALIGEHNGAAVGFLVGILDEPGHYRQVLRRRGFGLGASGLGALVVRPKVAWRFVRTRLRRYVVGAFRLGRRAPVPPAADRPSSPTPDRPAPRALPVLSHVVVAEDGRGSGVGAALVGAFTDAARAVGAPGARLLTMSGADGAAGFYERLGWHPTAEFVDADGVTWTRLEIELP